MTANPFTVLGLPTRPDLTDEQVRAAWRAVATAAHPDRADGGNPARYAAASAAYAALRTPWGRSEAYADLMAATPPKVTAAPRTATRRSVARTMAALALLPARVRHGRPLRLLGRVAAAVLLALVTVHADAGGPAETGVVAGLVVWCLLTVRGDLAPPPGR
jgi:hypothetical protein